MELIREAIKKSEAASPPRQGAETYNRPAPTQPIHHEPTPAAWSPPVVTPNPEYLERNRIVSVAMTDPSHVAFNLLRTKIYKTMVDNHWRTLAITSPTAACGKTVVSLNLAFALARQPNCRTVLIDLDLTRSSVARTVGLEAAGSVGQFLQGRAEWESCFVRASENLTLGLNTHHIKNASELMHEPRLKEFLQRTNEVFKPDFILFDLPPMLATDQALAFLPNVDASLLVVAAGKTTKPQIEECARHLSAGPGYLGVVLNKTMEPSDRYYYGAG